MDKSLEREKEERIGVWAERAENVRTFSHVYSVKSALLRVCHVTFAKNVVHCTRTSNEKYVRVVQCIITFFASTPGDCHSHLRTEIHT